MAAPNPKRQKTNTGPVIIKTPCAVDGAYVVDARAFSDARGSFEELYNITTGYSVTKPVQQVALSRSKADVLRGMHCSPYAKLVTCTQGEVFDVMVDLRPNSPTFMKWFGVWLSADNHKQVYIPGRCGHGFFAKEDDSQILYVQEGYYNNKNDFEFNCLDAQLSIDWPKPTRGSDYIMSAKDRNSPALSAVLPRIKEVAASLEQKQPDFLVMGASGFFGGEVIKALKEKKRSFATTSVRLEDIKGIEAAIAEIQPKVGVICAAGIAGKPNIDWCETHQPETIMANVVGQLNVAEACRKHNLHCTLFGTGFLYSYDKDHPQGSGKGFTEKDPPNFTENFYCKMRVQLESLIQSFDNVMSLRVVFPINADMHPRSVVAKLLKYPKIISVPTSFTVMDDLFPLIPDMADKKLTGSFNFTNPGVSTNGEILNLYKQFVDPSHTWVDVPPEDQLKLTAVKRPYSELDISKLQQHFPTKLPTVKESLTKIFKEIGANKSASSSSSSS